MLNERAATAAAEQHDCAAACHSLPSWGVHADRNMWAWMHRLTEPATEPPASIHASERLRQLGFWEGGECIRDPEILEEFATGRERRHSV